MKKRLVLVHFKKDYNLAIWSLCFQCIMLMYPSNYKERVFGGNREFNFFFSFVAENEVKSFFGWPPRRRRKIERKKRFSSN